MPVGRAPGTGPGPATRGHVRMPLSAWRGPAADVGNSPLSQWVGFLVFLALACLFIERRWTGYLMGAIALTGLAVLATRRDFDRTDLQFLLVVGLLPAAYLANMLIHGFGSSIFGRPARLLIGFFAFYAIRRAAPPPILFFDGCATGAVAAGLIALHQVELLEFERASAQWNAVPFGNYSILLGILVLCALLAGYGRALPRAAWYALALVMSVVALVLSKTRGSWVAVPVLLYLSSYARPGIRPQARWASAGVVVALVAGVAASSSGLQQRVHVAADQLAAYIETPESRAVQDTPVGLRLAMWKWGLERFAQHPLVGIGLVHYDDYRLAAVRKGELPEQFLGMANVHNQLIHFLAVGGLLMATVLVAFWVLAVRFFAVRLKALDAAEERAVAVAGLCIVVGTGLFSMSGGLFGTSPDSWAFAALLCMTAGFTTRTRDGGLHLPARTA
jgi:O-antigen ligase